MKAAPGAQLPIQDIFGRDLFIASLWRALEGNSVRMEAERRIGKTSILHKMAAEPIVSGSIVAEGSGGRQEEREPGVACWWNAMGFLPKSGASAVQVAVRVRPAATEAFVLDLGAHR